MSKVGIADLKANLSVEVIEDLNSSRGESLQELLEGSISRSGPSAAC